MATPISQKRVNRHQLPAGHVALNHKLKGSLLHQELMKGSAQLVLEGDLGVVDCYTGCDTGVIFLSEASVVNLTDSLQQKLNRLAKSQANGVVLLEQTPTSSQYLLEVQERLTIGLGLTCVPVNSPSHAAKMISIMSTNGDSQLNQFMYRGGRGSSMDPKLLQTVMQLPNTGKVKATALLEKFGSIHAISNASIEELAEVTSHSYAQQLYNFFRTPM